MTHAELIDGVVRDRDLELEFAVAELEQAERAATAPRDPAGRVDCRQSELITIDDETAADFDDAIGCRRLANGATALTVAIADVSAYVAAESPLDLAAKRRGNSVYLPDRVLPMLPPSLSAGACSLLPREDRLCVVCEMEVAAGVVRRYRFYRGLMRSAARLTYVAAAEKMSGDGAGGESETLPLLAKLCEDFRRRRQERGAMLLELPEKTCHIDSDGRLDIAAKERNIAHWAIEEAMIAANNCAADFLISRRRPALCRTHAKPPAENIRRLTAILAPLGISFPREPAAADFASALLTARRRDESLAEVLIPTVLGALSRATYEPNPDIGHFGLACERYLHFTSPIRRYPDLLTHRAIVAALADEPSPFSAESLVSMGERCSATEVNADKAGWDCRQRLLCLPALQYVGCEYTCRVSGVSGNGFFVTAAELGVDGFIRLSSMPGYWRHDEKLQRLTLARGGETLSLGDRVAARLKSVNPGKGRVDFDFLAKAES